MKDLKNEIKDLIDKVAQDQSVEIYEYSLLLKGVNSRINVQIDTGKNVSFGDCEKFSRGLSTLLDEAEILPNYFLEVSSPGLKREIRKVEEYKRFEGSPVKVQVDTAGQINVIKGDLLSSDGDQIVVKSEKKEYNINIADIKKANLDY